MIIERPNLAFEAASSCRSHDYGHRTVPLASHRSGKTRPNKHQVTLLEGVLRCGVSLRDLEGVFSDPCTHAGFSLKEDWGYGFSIASFPLALIGPNDRHLTDLLATLLHVRRASNENSNYFSVTEIRTFAGTAHLASLGPRPISRRGPRRRRRLVGLR